MTLDILKTYLEPLFDGALWTIALFVVSAVLSVAVGLGVCFCRMSSRPALRSAAKTYIEIVRGTPLLVQLFFIYYGLPELGIVMPGFMAGVLGLMLNFGAYLAELFRGGVQAVDGGQFEASRALGLSSAQRMRVIVIPQALRMIFPALGNYALVLVKDTSLVAVISVYELMRAGQMLAGATFRSLLVYSLVGAIYFAMCAVLSHLFRRAEKSLSVPGYWDGASDHNPAAKI
ncbi:amino acid ABC transporter permease [Burkholderia pyrrocinia]|uniref:amino acid ABC transporter permease n=1 Tax=Burkholderia pyrrocinia TaxID=60550 RepID=UPI001BCB4A0B|nr:amino acid ABC transporter permease [Burkholderia pyrrocinia]QVN17781.1 amino acid ABC transporter permease [Burkholderia pyrrocinia]